MKRVLRKKSAALLFSVVLMVVIVIFLPMYGVSNCRLDNVKGCYTVKLSLFEYVSYINEWADLIILGGSPVQSDLFPDVIGDFQKSNGVYHAASPCFYMNLSSVRRERICIYTTSVTYTDNKTDERVIVRFGQIIKGKEVFIQNREKYFKLGNLEGYSIGHTEGEELSWFPIKDFDMVSILEGSLSIETSKYPLNKKTDPGIGLVSLYFIDKYPPVNSVVNLPKGLQIDVSTKD